ncbi:MFS transporter [Streptomyces griseoaurantiacus]|uniref:MFS transporter n=1 Tax=Streptomyces griseoaurantiacus TaxID=68213 RepID=UPI0017822C8F|nr:MFS transporter [Streptomyces griseoaurantiacus]
MPSSPAPAGGPRRLTRTLYRYAFLDEFVLLYPVYALLFSDTGLSVWQISSLFALWSLTGVVLEVPSGALADGTSRRRLLVLAPLLTATGFALWVLLPSYASFAVGFVLWGAGGALGSGTLEALVYEELQRLGAADRYAGIMGRARACGLVAVMAAMALAGPVFAGGGYLAVGAASVLTCLLAAATATRLPEHRGPAAGVRGWTATLRAGLAEARDDRSVRGALLLVPAVTSVFEALDEYTPLLVRDTGVADRTVPWLLLLVWAGATAGGLLAGPGSRLGSRGLAALLAGAACALALGAASGSPAGLVGIAAAFGGFQLAVVLADARLQRRLTDSRRATLTSVAGLGSSLTTVAVYAGYGALATAAGHAAAFTWGAAPYLLTAALLARAGRRPSRHARNESPEAARETQRKAHRRATAPPCPPKSPDRTV